MTPRARRWLGRFATVVGLAAFAAGALLWTVAHSGLPERDERRQVPGLGAAVEIGFDARGVPHIEAGSLRDLAFAVGYCQANDRLLQLELGRRAAAGRLAEVLGAPLVGFDTRMRRLGVRAIAERSAAELGPEGRLLLDGYAAGVNAWLEARGGDLPPLVRLLGARPEPWTPADSMSFVSLMALQLESPGAAEERRMRVLCGLDERALSDLLHGEPVEVGPALAEWVAAARSAADGAPPGPAAVEPPRGGSNALAVAPRRSRSGGALLAGDPHLGLGLPAQWYLCGLHAPGYAAVGASLPGLPIVVIGSSDVRAWSFTNTGLDSSDLFLERWSTEGASLAGARLSRPVTRRTERIRVRFGDDVVIELFDTERGPLLPAEGGLPLRSLRFAAAQPGDPFPLFLALAREPASAALDDALESFMAPAQNLLYAQADGEIGRRVVGRVPERAAHGGRVPAGALESDWLGFRPAAANPLADGAARGFEVNANNDVGAGPGSLPFVAEYADPSRALGLERGLLALEGVGVDDLERLQQSRQSDFGERLRAALLELEPSLGSGAEGLELLRDWDGAFDEGPAAVFAMRLLAELREGLFADERARVGGPLAGERALDRLALRVLQGEAGFDWVDDPDTEAREELGATVAAALERALGFCRRELGGDLARWSLVGIQALRLEHALDDLPLLGPRLGRGPLPLSGHWSTPFAVWARWEGPRRTAFGGASLRFSIDLADVDAARWQLPGGQSGHPLDEHYDDGLDAWATGEGHVLPFHAAARAAVVRSRTRLEPRD